MPEIDWRAVELVIFDVDGTLYDQRCLRTKMALELAWHCVSKPWEMGTVRQIRRFRICRERLALTEAEGIGDRQYRWPAQELGVSPAEVRRTVEEWLLQRPLRHLRSCRFPAIGTLIRGLRGAAKTVAVLSDYPAPAKLAALDLEVDLCVSAVDAEVDRLKPHPAGLQRILELTGTSPDRALLIGDRDDRDGESARRAGVAYLLKSRAGDGSARRFAHYAQLLLP